MATGISYCSNCGSPIQPQTSFCPNCGTKVTTLGQTQHQGQIPYYPAPSTPQRPVSTGAYKAVIAVLLVIILIILVVSASGGLPFSLASYRYKLATPPSLQSTLPGPALTTQKPSYTIWNACGSSPTAGCAMSTHGWREGSVPDTFDYYVAFTSTVNVTVYFFTMGQFVQFSVCNGDVKCVDGAYDTIPATTSQPTTLFTLGEGCADYLAIYVTSASGILYPDVGVKPNAASTATGYCAQAGS